MHDLETSFRRDLPIKDGSVRLGEGGKEEWEVQETEGP